jgi:hypothetical protein
MNNLEESATWADLVKSARQRTRRRIERIDALVAVILLLALIFGWAVSFAPMMHWPGAMHWPGTDMTAGHSRHA